MTDEGLHISHLLAVQALHRGIDAADAGEPSRACPYKVRGGDLAEEFAAIWWIKGWCRRTESLRQGMTSR